MEKIQFKLNEFLSLNKFSIFILLVAPALVLIPLFVYETWPDGHDSTATVFGSWNIIKLLTENFHFPYAWQTENHEYNGNPFWLFYQPLAYFAVYLMSLITSIFNKDSIFPAMKLAVYISFLISELGMFFLLREILKGSERREIISVFGALIFLFAPYRLIDLYSRNAYSELWIFTWMPFYLLGFYKLFFKQDKNGAIILSIAMPCLILSHLMPSFFFIVIVHLAYLIFIFVKRDFTLINKKIFSYWLISNFIGIILCSFYLIPVLTNLKFCIGETFGFDRANLQHVLEHVPWAYFMLDPMNFGQKWQVGQLFLFGFIVINLILIFDKKVKHSDLLLFLNIIMALTLILLMSKTVWKFLPEKLYGLQFSWRLFLVYSCICSVLVALLVNHLKLSIPVLVLLLGFHIYTGKTFLYPEYQDLVKNYFDAESWANEFFRTKYTTANGAISYGFLPKTVFPNLFNFLHEDNVGSFENSNSSYFINLKPGDNVTSLKKRGSEFNYEMNLSNPTFLIFRQYFYPSWKLYIDSKPSNLYLAHGGYIGFEIQEGKHSVKLVSK